MDEMVFLAHIKVEEKGSTVLEAEDLGDWGHRRGDKLHPEVLQLHRLQ